MHPQASQDRAFSPSGGQISSEKLCVLPGTYCVRGFLFYGSANIKLWGGSDAPLEEKSRYIPYKRRKKGDLKGQKSKIIKKSKKTLDKSEML